MKNTTLLYTTSLVTLLSATMLSAQEFYLGAGMELGTTSDTLGPESDNFTTAGIIGGVKFDAGRYFYGAEVNYDFVIKDFEDPYNTFAIAGLDSTYRLRGIFGAEVSGIDLFASAGLFGTSGRVAIGSSTVSEMGFTYGIGAQVDVSEKIAIRLEVMQDEMSLEEFNYPGHTWKNTSVRAAAIFTF